MGYFDEITFQGVQGSAVDADALALLDVELTGKVVGDLVVTGVVETEEVVHVAVGDREVLETVHRVTGYELQVVEVVLLEGENLLTRGVDEDETVDNGLLTDDFLAVARTDHLPLGNEMGQAIGGTKEFFLGGTLILKNSHDIPSGGLHGFKAYLQLSSTLILSWISEDCYTFQNNSALIHA